MLVSWTLYMRVPRRKKRGLDFWEISFLIFWKVLNSDIKFHSNTISDDIKIGMTNFWIKKKVHSYHWLCCAWSMCRKWNRISLLAKKAVSVTSYLHSPPFPCKRKGCWGWNSKKSRIKPALKEIYAHYEKFWKWRKIQRKTLPKIHLPKITAIFMLVLSYQSFYNVLHIFDRFYKITFIFVFVSKLTCGS